MQKKTITVFVFILAVVLISSKLLAQQKPLAQLDTSKKMFYSPHGFTSAVAAGFFVPFEETQGVSFENSSGYRFNSWFAMCGTVAVDISTDYTMLPLSLTPQFDISKGKFTGFVNGDLGYIITNYTDYRGMFMGFDYGHKYYLKFNEALLFSVEFRYFVNPNAGGVIFKLGFQFH